MGFSVADRVKEKTTTTGVGSIALTGDYIDGFQPFSSGISSGETTFYVIDEPVLNNSDHWEVGVGTFVNGSLTRDVILSSSNNGQKINLSGSGIVSITYPAERSVYLDNALNTVAGSGVSFVNDPTKVLNTQNNGLYWDGKKLGYESSDIYISGIATYASGAFQNIGFSEYKNVTSDLVLNDIDDLIFVDSTDSEINVYMPLASGIGGKQIKIKWADGTNPINIIASGTETIDGQNSISMYQKYQATTLSSNNTNWFIT